MKKILSTILIIIVSITVGVFGTIIVKDKTSKQPVIENTQKAKTVKSDKPSNTQEEAIVEYNNILDFPDQTFIAIGYLDPTTQDAFEKIYFDNVSFDSVPSYDFRRENTTPDENGNKFIIVPKDEYVEIGIYSCQMNDNEELEIKTDLMPLQNSPFIIKDNFIEYIPDIVLVASYGGEEVTIPLTFSGENGRLDLSQLYKYVADISIYNTERE